MHPDPAMRSMYHCSNCGQETDVDGSTQRSGPCPTSGDRHAVDLLFHHRQAHNPADPDHTDPDCGYCQPSGGR